MAGKAGVTRKSVQFFPALANMPAFHEIANKRIRKEMSNYNRLKSDETRAKRLAEFKEKLAIRKSQLDEARRAKPTFRMTLGSTPDLSVFVYTKLIARLTE